MPRGQVFRSQVVKVPDRSDYSLTASAARAFSKTQAQQSVLAQSLTNNRAWQEDLWGYYDTVPEYRFGVDWVGNLLSKATLRVYEQQADGSWKPTTNRLALDVEASLFGGIDGQAEALRLIATNFEVAGEVYVINTPIIGQDADDWMVASAVEVQGSESHMQVEGIMLPPEAMATRIWKAHPRRSVEPNSPSRALTGTLKQIQNLTDVVDAQASSRLTSAGILWVPSEMELPAVPIQITTEDGTVSETVDMVEGATGLYNRLIQIASIAIRNRGSAAANVPLVISAPGEFLEKIQHTDFWSGFDEHVQKLREEQYKRLAIGMDMPPEIITGTADVNHWGAWQIEEAAIKTHTEPLLDVITSSITEGILRPFLVGSDASLDPNKFKFVADTTKLRMRPNRSKESIELWDRGALSTRTMLIENGFNPDTDQPDEKEKIVWFLTQVAAKTSATPNQLAAALQALGVKDIPEEEGDDTRGAMDQRSLEQHPTRDIPVAEESEAGKERPIVASGAFVMDGLMLASEVHVLRALERVGNRLKSKVGRNFTSEDTPAREIYLSVPNMSTGECEALLEDGFSTLSATPYPGVDTADLQRALHGYTLALIRRGAQHSRTALSRHLLLELAGEAA